MVGVGGAGSRHYEALDRTSAASGAGKSSATGSTEKMLGDVKTSLKSTQAEKKDLEAKKEILKKGPYDSKKIEAEGKVSKSTTKFGRWIAQRRLNKYTALQSKYEQTLGDVKSKISTRKRGVGRELAALGEKIIDQEDKTAEAAMEVGMKAHGTDKYYTALTQFHREGDILANLDKQKAALEASQKIMEDLAKTISGR